MVGGMCMNKNIEGERKIQVQTSLISVIVPVYNVQQYLEKCVSSLLQQTYEKFEIILIDDGSTDQSGILCDEIAEKDERILVIHKKNGGLSEARNVGIDAAKGEYLYFLDSDDYIAEDTLEKLFHKIRKENADLVIGGISFVDEEGGVIKKILPSLLREEVWNEEQFWENYYANTEKICSIVACNKLYHRKLFEIERYDVGKLHEDEYICHRIISRCSKIAIVNKALYYYLQRNSSIMGRGKKPENYFFAIEANSHRFEYFCEMRYIKFAEFVLFEISYMLLQLYQDKENLSKEQKKVLKRESKRNRKNYWKIIKGKHSKRYWINFFAYMMGLKTYVFLFQVYGKNKCQ